jgi:hypothetical protein
MIQRFDSREVTRRISNAAAGVNRWGRAPYRTRVAGFPFRLLGFVDVSPHGFHHQRVDMAS